MERSSRRNCNNFGKLCSDTLLACGYMREILYAKVVQSSFLEEPKREEGLSPPYRQRKLLRVLMRAKSERRSSSLCRETDGRAGCSNKLVFMPLRPLRFQLHMYESSESLVQQESKSCKVHKPQKQEVKKSSVASRAASVMTASPNALSSSYD